MAILINDNYSLQATKPFDARYMNISTPWTSCAAVIAAIPTYRYQGLTVNINGEEWWWRDGIADGDLIPKVLGGSSNLSGATNGLQLLCSNTNIGLGGILSQDTTICGGYDLNLGNSTSGLTALCGVTPDFYVGNGVLSGTSICFQHDQNTPHFDVCLFANSANSCAGLILDVDNTDGYFNAYTAPNAICYSTICLQTTDDNVGIFDVHSINSAMKYQKEAWISSSCRMASEAISDSNDSAQNIKSVMDYSGRSFVYSVNDSTILSILSGGTARYNSCVTLANDCDLTYKGYVDSALNSFTANNGLTKDGTNIRLGGSLTGSTTVTIGTNVLDIYGSNAGFTPSFQLDGTQNAATLIGGEAVLRVQGNNIILKPKATGSDCLNIGLAYTSFESTGGTGIRYDGDYENTFVDRSLITKKYVDSQVSGITGAITTANNGLTKLGQNVVLGGALTGSTNITGGGNKNLSFTTISGFSTCSVTNLACASTSMCLRSPSITLHNGVDNVINITSTCNILTDSVNSRGFVYASNYCAVGKTNPRWIPDAAYVTGLTSGFVDGAVNGLTKSGQDVKLGGTLCEATNICLGGGTAYSLCVKNSGVTTCNVAEFSPTILSLCSRSLAGSNPTGRMAVATSAALMCHGFSTCYSCLNMSNSLVDLTICGGSTNAQIRVTDNTTTPRGIEYTGNYNSTFSNCSLITKEYVTSQVSGITANAITTANNGLTKVGQNVVLGGALTGNTTITAGSNQFNVCGTNSNIRLLSSSVNLSGDTIELRYNGLNKITLNSNGTGIDGPMVFAQCKASYLSNFAPFSARELPDAAWVTGLTSSNLSINTFTGYTAETATKFYWASGATGLYPKAGENILLGGDSTICWDNSLTCIKNVTGGTDYLMLSANAYTSAIYLCADNTIGLSASSSFVADTPSFVLRSPSNSCQFRFSPTNGSIYSYPQGAPLTICSSPANISTDAGLLILAGGAACNTGYATNGGDIKICAGRSCCGTAGTMCLVAGYQVSGDTYSPICIIGLPAKTIETCAVYIDANGKLSTGESGAGSLSTANNGLCSSGQIVSLGGDLTGDTTIGGGTSSCIWFNAMTAFNVNATDIGFTGEVDIDGGLTVGNKITLGTVDTGDINTDEVLVIAPDGEVKKISGTTLNVSASNGLCANNNDVKLGGILSQATTISGGSQILRLGDTGSLLSQLYIDAGGIVQIQSSSIYTNASSSANYKGGNFCFLLDNTNANFCDNSGGKDGLKYASCISTGFTNSCSLVDKGYVDSNSNIVAGLNVTANYTGTTTSDFIGVSGATEIWLPPIPKLFQRVIVADICGDALNNNICIIGNGLCINGNDSATINTDYGAMTFINNGYSWSAVAFIN